MSYLEDAKSDAKETVSNFIDEIFDSFIEDDEASDDLFNDYPDGDIYHHENHVDKSYSLLEAAELLEELEDYEETDGGLWEGQLPKEAIETQAAYTYGNAVMALFQEYVTDINEDSDLWSLKDKYNDIQAIVQEEWDSAETEHYEQQAIEKEEWAESNPGEEFEETEFNEPFDVDSEIEYRQKELSKDIRKELEQFVKEL